MRPLARDPGVRGLVAIAFLALVLRLLAILALGYNPDFFDVDSYHWGAMEALSGRPIPTDFHPPGFSFVLSLFYRLMGPRPRLFYVVQAVLSALAVFLAGDAARRRFGPRAGVLTGLLLATSGYLVLFVGVLATETMCLSGVALLIWLLVPSYPSLSYGRLAAAASTVAALAFFRTGLLFLSVLVAVLALQKVPRPPPWKRLGLSAALLALGALPLVVAAFVRSYPDLPKRIGSASDVYNLWVGNNPAATGRLEWMPGTPRLGSPEAPDREAMARLLAPRVRRFLSEKPERQLMLFARRASYNFAPPKRDLLFLYASGWAGERSQAAILPLYAWSVLSVPILGAFVLLGFAKSGSDPGLRVALAVVFLGILPYQISLGDARYLQPFHPALAVCAGAVLAPAAQSSWSGPRRLTAALLATLFFSNAAYDVAGTLPALAAVCRPNASRLKPPYEFAR